MRIHRNLLAATACILVLGDFAWAQSRKAGLWEVTNHMTWQKSPMPPGMPAGANSPFGDHTTTVSVCVTQAQIDKYGSVPPQQQRNCQVTNIVKKSDGMSADMVCTGALSGNGTIVATFTDDSHSTSKIHFTGTMQRGPNSTPLEWTIDSSSAYKGADCGSVKPIAE
jgi:hypothetical protein